MRCRHDIVHLQKGMRRIPNRLLLEHLEGGLLGTPGP
jgi:hypothetical protein